MSGVAHDLNNPLGGISGYTQLLLEEETDPEKLGGLHRIMDEVQRCNRIVGDLLSFSRRHPVERSRGGRGGGRCARTLELRDRHLQGSGIRVQLEIAPGAPELRGDAHQLQQVFLNILINAEHALRQGGRRACGCCRAPPPSEHPATAWW